MNPFKSLVPLAKWLLRIAAAGIVYQKYLDTALKFSFNSLGYFMALAMVVFVVLLVVGGFLKTAKLTVESGILIVIGSLVILFGVIGFSLNNLLSVLPLASVGFYFMARGNNG